ncbi:L-proline glycine betaine ABC transport system permease protein ProW (TC 3.A.1.12.1) [Halomonas citrativorans]|uniref:L-proline glycine betaine ABC transport system permease protein ProW (TC 3.A.1.12.1) n=1 Tax=Halomonas citrativorans TaxID=2742612 RepID=A0A1R4I506_9GAMM|nr:ABC transporter permease [Halomonas citrativorans]SJN14917.1 L-proline glycine betaine ABC transport system permease protein ProW (TC 3.A.1.12.1) [Halomonas citrativorans]
MSLLDALPTPRLGRGGYPNAVLISLSVVMLAAVWGLDTVSVAPNRIVQGESVHVQNAFGWPGALLVSLLVIALGSLAYQPSRIHYWAALGVVVLLLVLMPFGLMVASHFLIDPELPQARLGIGGGYWVVLFISLLGIVELRLRLGLKRLWPVFILSGVGLIWWLCAWLWLKDLALVQEFKARDHQFIQAIRQHIILVSTAVSVSVVMGTLLALLMRRFARLQKVAFALLNFLQTIPSLALFGLLLAPLAWLAANVPFLAKVGVSGIGNTPALIALVAYSLLPMVRNTYTALEEVSPDTLEAASAMGMHRIQRFWQVRLPLALPVLLEGVRITTVQAIGLTAVAALIGAGGLGTFIFQGLGQAAMDMVLLGALPILILALLVDAGLGALAEALRPGGVQ